MCHTRTTHRELDSTHTHEACHTSRHLARFSECRPLISTHAQTGGARAPSLVNWDTRQTASRDWGVAMVCGAMRRTHRSHRPRRNRVPHIVRRGRHVLDENYRLRATQTLPVVPRGYASRAGNRLGVCVTTRRRATRGTTPQTAAFAVPPHHTGQLPGACAIRAHTSPPPHTRPSRRDCSGKKRD